MKQNYQHEDGKDNQIEDHLAGKKVCNADACIWKVWFLRSW